MIDHLSLPVGDIDEARRFYDAVLATLGHARQADIEGHDFSSSGYGPRGGHAPEPFFWIGASKPPEPLRPIREGQHHAFRAPDRAAVDAWYAAALAHGATDNGAPGIRAEYHASYYAAFAIDPDGNRLEAVCHAPG